MSKNQKGFGAVELFFILIIVGAIGVAGWYALYRKSDTAQPNKTSQSTYSDSSLSTSDAIHEEFDPTQYKVGQKFGPLTVVSVKPADPALGELSKTNAEIRFDGQVSLAGRHEYLGDTDSGAPQTEVRYFFVVSQATLDAQLPGLKGFTNGFYLLFANQPEAVKLIDDPTPSTGGEATIEVSDLSLVYNRADSDVYAKILSVVKAE